MKWEFFMDCCALRAPALMWMGMQMREQEILER